MKKEFTEKQLFEIRDAFGERCCDSIGRGEMLLAEQELKIINVAHSQIGIEEYKSLQDFKEAKDRIWYDPEKAAVRALVEWAGSEDTEPTEKLYSAIDDYFKSKGAVKKDGVSRENLIGHRESFIDGLIILCIRSCTQTELLKMDKVKTALANHL